ncbi:PLP-dependent aminotransferase family protein [Lacimicrobium sp. SS2-24]|uniref:aminotransferase-like domain-containing protein n=1 Tax=Lacimicrobium sp. SS2-24 TaxID=2005569 RepID=UPI000B4B3443|nr:PLP-dependent aminotransferase family protein [Lacimicrobium sp. SS2-24]
MQRQISREQSRYLYRQVADLIRDMRENGTLRPGDRIPSLRHLAEKLQISVPTVKQAYEELERIGMLESRPKSGYYLTSFSHKSSTPRKSRMAKHAIAVTRQELVEQVHTAVHTPGTIPFGISNPVGALPNDKALARWTRRVMSSAREHAIGYGPFAGFEPLRRQLVLRYLDMGLSTQPEQLVITNGAQEALAISLQLFAKPGDVIAVESPCYFGILELIESLGMLAYEIPLCAETGISLDDVATAIDKHPIKACVFSSSITNPMGASISDADKQALVLLLESKGIGLIEDDVYGDLYFGQQRGKPAQCYSEKGLVITCSSFSKTAAPGHRVGWLLSPTLAGPAARLKRALSCSSALLNQWVLTEYLASGEYDRYLRQLRQVLYTNKERMRACILENDDSGLRLTNPAGGAVLWLELSRKTDGSELFHQALSAGMSIMPGSLFAPSERYRHCIRLSYGLPWSDKVEEALIKLLRIMSTLSQ